MKLYIANCTRQNWVVHYRQDFLPDGTIDPRRQNQLAKQQPIAPGRQEMIASDSLHISQIDDIVNQLTPYGLVAVADVPGLKTRVKKFDPRSLSTTPLVFNVDKPVPIDVFRMVQAVNERIYVDQGKERRARAAVAVNSLVQEKVGHELMAAGVEDLPTTSVDVAYEQLEQSEAGEKTIAEGYKVDTAAPLATPPTGRKGRGKRAA